MKTGSTMPALIVTAGAVLGLLGTLPTPAHGTAQLAPLFLAQAQVPASPQEPNRDQAVRENQGRFEDWGRKIDDFNAKAAERTSEAREKTRRELDKAWSEVKSGWDKLRNASREGWQDAKDALESSWRKLERAWNDAQS